MIITINPDCIGVTWLDDNVGVISISPIPKLNKTRVNIDIACAGIATLDVAVGYIRRGAVYSIPIVAPGDAVSDC